MTRKSRAIVFVAAAALFLGGAARAAGDCAACANASFGPAARSYVFPAPGWVLNVVSADFNGDGIPDLAAVTGSQNVQILLGTGAGTFVVSATQSFPVGAFDLYAADMDGDGKADLLVPHGISLTVLLLDAAGHVRVQKQTPAAFSVSALATADWTGDGKVDVAIATDSGTSVQVLPGDGLGGFGTPISINVPTTSPPRLIAGDFTGDGLMDLGVLRPEGYLSIYPGTGGPSFAAPRSTAVTLGNAVVADFNRDGILDVAVGSTTLLGTGGGHFQSLASIPGSVQGKQPVGDFNQDGIPDLIVQNSQQGLSVALGDGAGGFSLGPAIEAGTFFTSVIPVAAADFDGDGKDDLAIARNSDLAVFRGAGGGHFESPPESPTTPSVAASQAYGDFNGDGRLDVVKVDGQNVVVLFNRGDGTFGPAVVTPVPQAAYAAAADFNGDGHTDLAVTRNGLPNVLVLLGNGTGHFGPPSEFTAAGGSMIVADFNLDGHPDLLVGLDVLLGNGAGGFGSPRHAADGTIPLVLAVEDVNGDGRPDILVNSNNFIVCYLGDGAGGFTAGPVTDVDMYPWSIVIGDFNADGHADFAVTRNAGLGNFPPYLKVFFGNGTGAFGSQLYWDTFDGFLLAADFHGDGRSDIAVSVESAVVILRVDPSGALTESGSFGVPGYAASAADFTGDGRADLLGFTGSYSASPNIWLVENTICRARRLATVANVSSCDAAGTPFASQPVVGVVDDGGNLISCAGGTVAASLAPGTGTPGAMLSGTTSIPVVSGLATFTDLSVTLPGRGYRLRFARAGAAAAGSRSFSASLPPPAITLPPQACTAGSSHFEAAAGYDSYLWKLDGAVVGRSRVLTLASLSQGSHSLQLTVTQDGCLASSSVSVAPNVTPAPPVASNNGPVPYGGTIQLFAAGAAGATYQWTGPGGFVSPVQNPVIPNAVAALGGIYRVAATVGGCASAVASTTVTVLPVPWCAGCARPAFGPASAHLVGVPLLGTATGDFDGDGLSDVVVGVQGLGVRFFPGDGLGGYGAAVDSTEPVGFSPLKILAADLNRDGLLDLVIPIPTSGGILVALGKDGGHFGPAQTVLPGKGDAVVGDFNEDGWPDLAAVGPGSSVVTILVNDGTGGFLPGTDYTVGSSPVAVAIGDFNGNHHTDIAVVNSGSQNVSILLGSGNGGFGPATNYGIPKPLSGIAVGDFNHDNVPDLAVSYGDFTVAGIEILTGSGTGTFTDAGAISPFGPSRLEAADVNGDGKDDLVFISGDLMVLLGMGNSDFESPISLPAGDQPRGFALGDVDRDGRTDAVVAGDGQFAVLRSVLPSPPAYHAGEQIRGVVSADFDQDGHPDIAVTTTSPYGVTGGVSVLLNNGAGVLGSPISVSGGSGVTAIAAADFNGDGFPDLVTADVAVFLNDGAGALGPPLKYPLSGNAIAVGEFNGDGRKDLAVGTSTALWILSGNGAGGFSDTASIVLGISSVAQVAAGDFNLDGKADLAVLSGGGDSVSIALGTGHGTFGSLHTVPIPAGFAFSRRLAIGDLNGDGKPDVAVAAGQLLILLGDGTGGLGPPSAFGSVSDAVALLTGDFNGDGGTDLALLESGSSLVSIFNGNGTGGFASPDGFVARGALSGAAAVDLDGDGRPDIVAGGYYGGDVTVLFNTNCVARRLGETAVPSCAPPGQVLAPQPAAKVLDDAGNVVACDTGAVTAAIATGTGTPGAVLGGTTTVNAVSGIAAFTDLSVDRNGAGYRLEFQHSGLSKVRSPAFSVGTPPASPVAGNGGPACAGGDLHLTASLVEGAIYRWTGPNGFASRLRNPVITGVTALAAGTYSVTVTVNGCTSAPAMTTATIITTPSPTASNNGPVCVGQTLQLSASTVSGATYAWTGPNAFTSSEQNPQILSAPFSAGGVYSVTATANGCTSQPATTSVTIRSLPSASISAPSSICPMSSGVGASVPSAGAGAAYSWTIGNGTITSGAGTRAIVFTPGPSGSVQLDVTVTNSNGCVASGSRSIPITDGPQCGASFFTVAPCRVADTREADGTSGGPALVANATRTFPVAGICGIPSSAVAVAINLAVFNPSDGGDLRVYGAGEPAPLASSINFRPGIVRANNAIVPLGAGGQLAVQCDMPSGGTHFFFDVYGYFE